MTISTPTLSSEAPVSSPPAPVSRRLEEELREELRTRGVLVWLDKNDEFGAFVDALRVQWQKGTFPYPVCAYRGSFLELMLQLDGLVDGRSNRPLVVHMPGFNFDEVRQTPILELYEAGKVYRKALSTLVMEAAAGKVAPEEIRAFVDQQTTTLQTADQWLAAEVGQSESYLDQLSLFELWERLRKSPEKLSDASDMETYLRARLGISANWAELVGLSTSVEESSETAHLGSYFWRLSDWMTTWALAAEYVYDLRRSPVAEILRPFREFPRSLAQECTDFVESLRRSKQHYYVRITDEFTLMIGKEVEAGRAEDLGDVDTFRFEDTRSLEAALAAVGEGRWEDCLAIAQQRTPERSFWIRHEPRRGDAWQLVQVAARLGAAIEKVGDAFAGAMSVEEATNRYAESIWVVDQAHRLMEQRRAALLVPSLPQFSALLDCLDGLRGRYRKWSNQLANRFTTLCENHGFLATESMQQRRIFDQVVAPMVNDKGAAGGQKVALFLVDALRFEMAASLEEFFGSLRGTKTYLRPRLAELPSMTSVGMNVIPPVHKAGRLEPVIRDFNFAGFQTPQFQVNDPKSRQRMMQHFVGGRTCPWLGLDEVLSGEKDLSYVIRQASLVIVHSRAIDEVGEKGYGQLTFKSTLRDIRSAMGLLRQAGVRRFVLTADHGFLMLDQTTTRYPLGNKKDPKGRWRLYEHPQSDEKLTSVPLSALGYVGRSEHLVLLRDTSVFDTGGELSNFIHGGNSPQERIIPVLTVEHEREMGGSTTTYRVIAAQHRLEKDLQGLTIRVERSQATLDFGSRATVELAIGVPDRGDVAIELQRVNGPAEMEAASVLVPLDETVEVFFHLRGERDEKVRVEVYSPTMGEQVTPCTPTAWFDVFGVGKIRKEEQDEQEEPVKEAAMAGEVGLEGLPEGPRKIFEYLAKYGALTEGDAARLLGSPRALRQFSRNFEDYAVQVAFEVIVEQTAQGKRYVRK